MINSDSGWTLTGENGILTDIFLYYFCCQKSGEGNVCAFLCDL